MPTKDSNSLTGLLGRPKAGNDRILSDAAKKATEKKGIKPDRAPSQGFGLVFLDELWVVIDNTGSPASAIAWTTYDAAPAVPSSAKGLLLVYRARNIEAPTGEKAIYVRRERGSVEMQIASVRGTTTSDITSNAGQAFVELTNSKTFDFKASAMSDQYIAVVGYYN